MTGELFVKIADIKENTNWFLSGTFVKDKVYPVLEIEMVNSIRKLLIVDEANRFVDVEMQRTAFHSYKPMAQAILDVILQNEEDLEKALGEEPQGTLEQ